MNPVQVNCYKIIFILQAPRAPYYSRSAALLPLRVSRNHQALAVVRPVASVAPNHQLTKLSLIIIRTGTSGILLWGGRHSNRRSSSGNGIGSGSGSRRPPFDLLCDRHCTRTS